MKDRRTYPQHPKEKIPDGWRQQVKTALAARADPDERSVEWLARAIGADPGGIRRLLTPPADVKPQNTSAWYESINKQLGLSDPGPRDDRERRLIERFRAISEQQRIGVLALIGADSPTRGDQKK